MNRIALDDPDRLAVLADLAILDTPPESAYDDLARLAAACCHSDIAAVNFVDDHRHWTKAIVGVEGGQGLSVAADISFCSATVKTPGGMLSVPDTTGSVAWHAHPFVSGPPHLRFYAGAAIVVTGQPVGVVCVFGDQPRTLTEQEQEALVALARQASAQLELRSRNAELHALAVRDPLTGLANRTLLLERLELAVAERERGRGGVGVLYCDVDCFKQVNDRFGHAAGDQLLREIADRLRAATRATDTVARFAGDEFVVVCPGLASAAEFEVTVERVDRIVNAPSQDDLPDWRLSIGAGFFEDGDTADDVLRRADDAMYRAKPSRHGAWLDAPVSR